jgi:hypothetical protein
VITGLIFLVAAVAAVVLLLLLLLSIQSVDVVTQEEGEIMGDVGSGVLGTL